MMHAKCCLKWALVVRTGTISREAFFYMDVAALDRVAPQQ